MSLMNKLLKGKDALGLLKGFASRKAFSL